MRKRIDVVGICLAMVGASVCVLFSTWFLVWTVELIRDLWLSFR